MPRVVVALTFKAYPRFTLALRDVPVVAVPFLCTIVGHVVLIETVHTCNSLHKKDR